VKILVADDHPLIREAFRHLLADLAPDVTVIEAGDCETTRRLAAEHPDLDLVLLDLRLPGPGGLATLDALRHEYPTLPVVVVSAVEDPGAMRNVLAHGAMGFIPKSSTNVVMLNALRLVLSGGRYLPDDILSADGSSPATAPATAAELHLTDRQREVLALMVQGKSNKLICRELGLAEATVKIHVTAILRALRVTSRAQAIVAVNQLGLTPESLSVPMTKG
jgi:DNA-binding NarL/FixJ family response regulator